MGKLPVLSGREVIKILKKVGFGLSFFGHRLRNLIGSIRIVIQRFNDFLYFKNLV